MEGRGGLCTSWSHFLPNRFCRGGQTKIYGKAKKVSGSMANSLGTLTASTGLSVPITFVEP